MAKEKKEIDFSRVHLLPYPATTVSVFQACVIPSLEGHLSEIIYQ